jgi:hypothetical protein
MNSQKVIPNNVVNTTLIETYEIPISSQEENLIVKVVQVDLEKDATEMGEGLRGILV